MARHYICWICTTSMCSPSCSVLQTPNLLKATKGPRHRTIFLPIKIQLTRAVHWKSSCIITNTFFFLFVFRLLIIPPLHKEGINIPLYYSETNGICLASSTVKVDKMRETAWKSRVSEGLMTLSCVPSLVPSTKPSLASFVLLSIFWVRA